MSYSSQICGKMSVDLLATWKHLNENSGIFVYVKNAINPILRLTLRRMLTQSLELKFLYENRCVCPKLQICITHLRTTFDRPQRTKHT